MRPALSVTWTMWFSVSSVTSGTPRPVFASMTLILKKSSAAPADVLRMKRRAGRRWNFMCGW